MVGCLPSLYYSPGFYVSLHCQMPRNLEISESEQAEETITKLKQQQQAKFLLENQEHQTKSAEMEYKIRKESQTLVEKVFNSYERRGYVRSYQLGSMLRALNPELALNDEDLRQRFTEFDTDNVGALDFDSFNRLALFYLVQQTRRESDGFAHKHLIRLNDFQ
ncbi:Troponin C, isoform 2 [Orchesella cincta]|uniref:Troponin C, isoform 2 n=1 Tax=Orchesella cincta TaxID=48709 RepID=A0A1D2N043_ORCCI|nr:Troponin C, isoform 2 [Orchesella cincta]